LIPTILQYVGGALIGYLFGAIPSGYFAGRLWNVDVRKHGSGRTGGTNVLRSAGWAAFALTALADVTKGIVAVLLSRALFPGLPDAHALTVLGVLIGHNWSIWIAMLAKPDPRITFARPPLGWFQRIAQQGRGGAGVAVTAAATVALFPPIMVIVPVFILLLVVVRYASVASLSAAVFAPFAMIFFVLRGDAPWSYFLVVLLCCAIVVVVHIPNIRRLRAGTERRFGERLGQKTSRNPPTTEE
jgi:acyl phosphate:glycerol-3-phosphate acyltransferase